MSEEEEAILVIRAGPGANCSSVGSVIDLLFAAGVVGGALLVAVTAALAESASQHGESGTAAAPKREEGVDESAG